MRKLLSSFVRASNTVLLIKVGIVFTPRESMRDSSPSFIEILQNVRAVYIQITACKIRRTGRRSDEISLKLNARRT